MPPPAPTTPIINVAAAVIFAPDGRFLLAQRPVGKPWAGYWEFPGGKFEPGEDESQALARELHEELGIEVDQAWPWITRVFAYPERTVRLHFHRVPRWHGEPHGKENQALAWQSPENVTVAPLLPANAPVLKALALPPVYAITGAARFGMNDFLNRVQVALERGVRLIQVREHDMPAERLEQFARRVIKIAQIEGARVLINGDQALAVRVQADGVHWPAHQLMNLKARPDLPLCAASCHNRAELDRAAELELDFVVLSPVLSTPSHPGVTGLGWPAFAGMIRNYPLPVYALGGMRLEYLTQAMEHGAHGASLLSGIW